MQCSEQPDLSPGDQAAEGGDDGLGRAGLPRSLRSLQGAARVPWQWRVWKLVRLEYFLTFFSLSKLDIYKLILKFLYY